MYTFLKLRAISSFLLIKLQFLCPIHQQGLLLAYNPLLEPNRHSFLVFVYTYQFLLQNTYRHFQIDNDYVKLAFVILLTRVLTFQFFRDSVALIKLMLLTLQASLLYLILLTLNFHLFDE